ncbi:MAG: hypothetical protein Kow0090_04250 [Myxococcota bacterium]
MLQLKGFIRFFKFRPAHLLLGIEIFFVVLSALFAAKMVNALIAEGLRELPTAKKASIGKSAVYEVFRNIPKGEIADSIKNQNIFGSASEPEVAPPPTDEEIENALGAATEEGNEDCPVTTLRAQLAGALYAPNYPEFHAAAITDLGTQQTELYRIGDKLMGEAAIKQIDVNRVVLEHQGKRVCLYLGGKKELPPEELGIFIETVKKKSGYARAEKRVGVTKTGENRWNISRKASLEYIQELEKHSDEARLAPNFNGGKPEGFRFTYIRKGTFFDMLGFSEGDIVIKANDFEIGSLKDAYNALNALRASEEVIISLKRGEEERANTYILE